MFGSIVIAAADPSSVHRCASDSITCQLLIELGKDVGKSEVAKRRNSGAGRPGRVTGGLNEGSGRHRTPGCAASAARMSGSIVVAAADPSSVHRCASDSITCQLLSELGKDVDCAFLSCLCWSYQVYTAVMSFEILLPFVLWVFGPGWLFTMLTILDNGTCGGRFKF